jgi:Sec-independent protein secretion pathway component TatC
VEQEKRLSIAGHLQELRKRLLRSVVALGIGIVVSFPLAPYIFDILKSRAEGVNLIYTRVTEMIGIYIKVALYCGIALVLPYLVYQLVMFLSPALRDKEKRYVYLSLPAVFILFAAGVCFAYFLFCLQRSSSYSLSAVILPNR